MTNALERLVEQLRRLPGIGSKSARRLAYHLVEMPKEEVDRLVETIVEAKGATRHCSICFNLSAQDPCEFSSAVVTIRAYITYWKAPCPLWRASVLMIFA